MRLFVESAVPEFFRRGGIWALLIALLMTLAACGGGPKLLPADDTAKNPGQTVPPVVVERIEGLPPDKTEQLLPSLALAAGQRDIGIVVGELPGGAFRLTGQFQAMAGTADVRLAYQWQLRDAAGVLVHTISGSENAGLFTGTDVWHAVTATTLERLAQATADSLSVRLGQLGYSTRVAALDKPPSDYFVPAGQGAEREVDMALLDGVPPPPDPAMDGLGGEADLTEPSAGLPDAGDVPLVELADEMGADGSEPGLVSNDPLKGDLEASEGAAGAEPAADGKFEIRAVAVLPVQGAGEGGQELTAAMRRTLAAAGWPVISEPRPDAITVQGRVRVSDPRDGEQNVSVRWEVKTPGGSQLGDVKQANRVPAGSFDSGWGDAAFAVAEAAAMGIFDIVSRFQ